MIGGKIHINEQTIMEWSATNEGMAINEETCLYSVHAHGWDGNGRHYDEHFVVYHTPRFGAVFLTQLIMARLTHILLKGNVPVSILVD